MAHSHPIPGWLGGYSLAAVSWAGGLPTRLQVQGCIMCWTQSAHIKSWGKFLFLEVRLSRKMSNFLKNKECRGRLKPSNLSWVKTKGSLKGEEQPHFNKIRAISTIQAWGVELQAELCLTPQSTAALYCTAGEACWMMEMNWVTSRQGFTSVF